eukprot:Gb_15158 [translate_table: standard]
MVSSFNLCYIFEYFFLSRDSVKTEFQDNEQKIEKCIEERNDAGKEQKSSPVWIEPPTSTVRRRTYHSSCLVKSTSDTPPTGDLVAEPLPTRLKKLKTFEPNQVNNAVQGDTSDPQFAAEVDAKAEDFIQKFKRQLKMQRIESFKRYREMIDRAK